MFPIEIMNRIYGYLSMSEINEISTVNRHFYNSLHYHIRLLYINNNVLKKYIYKIVNDIKYDNVGLHENPFRKCIVCSDNPPINIKKLYNCNYYGEICYLCGKHYCYKNVRLCFNCKKKYCRICIQNNSCITCMYAAAC